MIIKLNIKLIGKAMLKQKILIIDEFYVFISSILLEPYIEFNHYIKPTCVII